jgi:hypothetical protein
MRNTLVFCAIAALVILVLSSCVLAQTASVNGTVTDPTGAVIDHANISVRNIQTNALRRVETSGSGVYSLTDLPAGIYEIVVEKTGFKTIRYQNVILTVDQILTLNTKFELGATQEQVTVEGAVVPVDTTDAQLSNVVEHQQMTELPLILRDPYQLVLLSAGVTQSDGLGGVSVNGGRERNNNFLLDGADNNDTETPGYLGGLTSENPDSTEEFRVITNNFAPEFGRNNGAVIDVITKSGTNDFHGNVFYFGRWDALGARGFFNHEINPLTGLVLPKDPYIRNLYGASLGGPIVRDKTFFFINYQGDRFITNLTNTSVVPTEDFKTGIFTFTNTDPGCTSGCSQPVNVTIPGSINNGTSVGLDPVMQQILALYPAPNSSNGDGITGQLFFPSESRRKDEDADLKIDHKISKSNSFSARYIYNWFSDPNYDHSDFLPGDLGATSAFNRTQSLALSLTSTPSTTLVNELRASFNRTNQGYACTGTALFDSFGYLDQLGRGADFNLPAPLAGFGCSGLTDANDQGRKSGTFQYWDNLTKVAGSHTMKFGGEFRNVYSNNFSDFNSRAAFTFNLDTGSDIQVLQNINPNVQGSEFLQFNDMTSALLGLVNEQAQTQFFTKDGAREANDELDFRQREFGIFAEDSWKVLPNLTFTYGLRWEYYGVPFEAHGNLSNLFQNSAGSAPFTFTPVGPGTGQQLFAGYHRNFEPRFGFAWDPFRDGKTSVRGGIGVFSDRIYGNLISDARGNPPFQPSVANFYAANDGPTPAAQLQYLSAPSQLVPTPIVTDTNSSLTTGLIFPDLFATNIKPPSVVSWNFGVQRQLSSNLTVEANYVANHGTRILRVIDGNGPQPALVQQLEQYCNNPGNAYACNISTLQFGNLFYGYEAGVLPFDAVYNNAFFDTFTDQTSGHSWYNGLQAQLTERNFHGLQLGFSYTWAHALDDSSDPLTPTANNGNFPVDSFDLARERGNSGYDTRQRAVMNFIYQPNIGRGKTFLSDGILGRALEGWEISGVAQFQSGLPYDIYGPLDTLHTNFADRATVVNSSVLKTTPSTGRISSSLGVFTGENPAGFNPDDGSIPIPWDIPANVVRNNWYGPGLNDWAISFSKMTSLTERFKLQLRFETYNLFNRPEFTKPNNIIGSPNEGYSLGTITLNDGTTSARQIQIAGKIIF